MEFLFNKEPMRLDVYILGEFPDMTRSHIKNMITSGNILVNNKSVKAGQTLKPGDKILVELPEP